MKNSNKILKNIMVFLGMEIKLEQMKLADGMTVIEADSFEPDMEVFIVAEDEQKIPLPVNQEGKPYELEDGRLLNVVVEGIIESVMDAPAQEEEEAEVEVPVEAEAELAQAQPKVITESTVKEYKFSQEEMDAKDSKIAELEAKILELTKVEEEVELSEMPKPIMFNPENSNPVELVNLTENAPKGRRDSILESIYNSK
jgi:hypothetical protein